MKFYFKVIQKMVTHRHTYTQITQLFIFQTIFFTSLSAMEELQNQLVQVALAGNQNTRIGELIRAGAQVNSPDKNGLLPLVAAYNSRKFRTFEILLDFDANPDATVNEQGHTLLMRTIIDDYFEQFKKLLAKDANINAVDQQGQTALMKAAQHERLDYVLMLLDLKADISIMDNAKKTAHLHSKETHIIRSREAQRKIFNAIYEKEQDIQASKYYAQF